MNCFCNIINVFAVTFDQFIAFFMNKTINWKKKKWLTPIFLTVKSVNVTLTLNWLKPN